MSETISKASVCDILADIYPTDGEKVVAVKEIDKAYEAIQQLPSVHPKLPENWWKTDHGYMWLCPHCGLPVHSDFEECLRCGTKRQSAQPEQKYTLEEVAEILSSVIGDECACNINGIDEWLPERCKYTEIGEECPNPKEKHGCWMQFLLQGGGADMRGEQE